MINVGDHAAYSGLPFEPETSATRLRTVASSWLDHATYRREITDSAVLVVTVVNFGGTGGGGGLVGGSAVTGSETDCTEEVSTGTDSSSWPPLVTATPPTAKKSKTPTPTTETKTMRFRHGGTVTPAVVATPS